MRAFTPLRRSVRCCFVIALTLASIPARADEPPNEGVTEPHPPASPAVEPAAPSPGPPAPVPPPVPVSVPVAAAAAAPPARPSRLGDARVLVVNGTVSGTIDRSDTAPSIYDVTIAPALDYFLAENFSVGVSPLLGYQHTTPSGTQGETLWKWGASGQLGFNVWLTERLSLWPKAFLQFVQFRATTDVPAVVPSNTAVVVPAAVPDVANVVSAGIYAPFLFHLAPHFFVGLGPSFSVDLYATAIQGTSTHASAFGLSSTVGGWL